MKKIDDLKERESLVSYNAKSWDSYDPVPAYKFTQNILQFQTHAHSKDSSQQNI